MIEHLGGCVTDEADIVDVALGQLAQRVARRGEPSKAVPPNGGAQYTRPILFCRQPDSLGAVAAA
jgi:hypothetical protein